jgi:hypothetical protein
MNLKRRWLAFCRRAGAAGQEEQAFADLDRRYREPGRHYHTWAHVASCLRELRRARPQAGEAAALELAVWFHDAVYEPGRKDNEEVSAQLALRWASTLGLAPALGRRVDPGYAREPSGAGLTHRGASVGHRSGGAGRGLAGTALRAGHRGSIGRAAGGLPRGRATPARLPERPRFTPRPASAAERRARANPARALLERI